MSRAGIGICRQCGKPVRWTRTEAGKALAVNPEPDADGNTAAYRDGLGAWRSRRPTEELPVLRWERLYMPHVATCVPVAEQLELDLKLPELPEGVADFNAHRRKRGR